jgi:hypothetical protein
MDSKKYKAMNFGLNWDVVSGLLIDSIYSSDEVSGHAPFVQ